MASDDEVTEALARIGEGHGSESVLRSCVDVLCRRVATLRAELAERTRELDLARAITDEAWKRARLLAEANIRDMDALTAEREAHAATRAERTPLCRCGDEWAPGLDYVCATCVMTDGLTERAAREKAERERDAMRRIANDVAERLDRINARLAALPTKGPADATPAAGSDATTKGGDHG